MKACPHCRAEYTENLIYCTKDGSPLIDTEAPTADDIEIDTYVRKSEIPAVKPISDPETQSWEGDEFAATVYDPKDEAEFTETYAEVEEDDFDDGFEDDSEDEQDESVGYQKPIESENKRSYVGLIVGALALFGILILGAALVGAFLYYQSQNQSETASTNTNQESNSALDFPSEDANQDLSNQDNSNTEDSNSEGDLLGDIDSTTGESSSDKRSDSDKNKDKDRDKDKDTKKTPTPNTSTKTDRDSTGADKASTPDRNVSTPNPTPERRTTPTPPRAPRQTPTPQRSIPSRISGGVVNGKAVSLPVPAYPSVARSARVTGAVNVQVVISKSGSVLSARAVSGHPLLRSAAVNAARRARFRPTMLSGQPVEVSGVIVYNFRP